MLHLTRLSGSVTILFLFAIAPALAQGQPAAAAPRPAAAAPGPIGPAIIGVVDMSVINQQGSAPKSVHDQMEKQAASFQAEISKHEGELRQADQDLQQQRTLLSADAFAEKRRGFEQQLAEYQKQAAARRRQLDQAIQEATLQIDAAMKVVLSEIAGERGLTVILPKQSTLLSANALDITKDVQTRLDKRLPHVALKLPPLQK